MIQSMEEATKKVGGARRNAGRKTEMLGTPMKTVALSLDARTVDLLKVLGDGNTSRGVREAARVAYERYQRDVRPGKTSARRDADA